MKAPLTKKSPQLGGTSNEDSRPFAFSDLDASLQRGIRDLGFEQPTPIQRKAIPPGLAGRDVLACAMTGSGKTAAFLLPILERFLRRPRGATRALVISPTRELAAQTVDHFRELARHTKLRAAAVYGGVGMGPQIQAFRRGVDLIVSCPGRLLDHFQYPYARLAELEVLVLDEADRMLDMGFLPDIKRVLRHLPPVEQRLLFSATMPPPIAELSNSLLERPVRLDIERAPAPAPKIEQAVFEVSQELKPSLLLALLEHDAVHSALVFTRTKHRADRLANALERQGVAADRIHGNRSQGQRIKALEGFKRGRTRVLVATDIAARGIDVEALSHVVNFDVPNLAEDYIHRVGRTARAEATGIALTFVAPQERSDLRTIENAVGRLPRRQLEGFDLRSAPRAGVWTPQGSGTAQGATHAQPRPQRSAGPRRPARHDSAPPRGRRPADTARPARQGSAPPRSRRPADTDRPARRSPARRANEADSRPASPRRDGRRPSQGQSSARSSNDQRPAQGRGRNRPQARPAAGQSNRDERPAGARPQRRPKTAGAQSAKPRPERADQRKSAPRNDRPAKIASADNSAGKKPRRRRGRGNNGKPETTAFAMFERTGPSREERRKAHRVAYP